MRAGPAAGMPGGQPVGHLLDDGDLAGLRFLPLAAPPAQEPLDVAVLPAEIAQADGGRFDGVEVGQRVDQ